MAETPKRLKKNISFSEHELDIFEYLNRQKNASAFIKKLVRNQMIIDEGIVSVQVVKVEPKKENVPCETQEETEPEVTESETIDEPQVSESEETESESEETESESETEEQETVDEPEETDDNSIEIKDGLQPLVEIQLSDEDLENQDLLPEL